MKERWIALLLLALVLLAGGGYAYYHFASTPVASEPTLRTTQVRREDIVISVSGTGNLLPGQEVNLGFRTSGTLISLTWPYEVTFQIMPGASVYRITGYVELQNHPGGPRVFLARASFNLPLIGIHGQ